MRWCIVYLYKIERGRLVTIPKIGANGAAKDQADTSREQFGVADQATTNLSGLKHNRFFKKRNEVTMNKCEG